MPTAPDVVLPTWTPSAPAGPTNTAGPRTVAAPTAPAVVLPAGSPAAPSAPAGVAASPWTWMTNRVIRLQTSTSVSVPGGSYTIGADYYYRGNDEWWLGLFDSASKIYYSTGYWYITLRNTIAAPYAPMIWRAAGSIGDNPGTLTFAHAPGSSGSGGAWAVTFSAGQYRPFPALPDGVLEPAAASSPAAPGATLPEIYAPGGWPPVLGGNLSPALIGTLLPLPNPAVDAWGGQGPQWTSDGLRDMAESGLWCSLIKWLLKTPAAATVEAIAPRANYTAHSDSNFASRLYYWNGTAWVNYYLYNMADSDPVTSRWCLIGGGTTDQGGATIPAGALIIMSPFVPGYRDGDFLGGLGAGWAASSTAVWRWDLTVTDNETMVGSYHLDATSFTDGPWIKDAGTATGLPVFTTYQPAVAVPAPTAPARTVAAPTAPTNTAGPRTVAAPTAPAPVQV